MNETTPKKKRGLVLPIAIAIVAIAVIGFIASRAGLDKALVKQQLDQFAADLKERGHQQGRDLSLSYGELEVVGSFASKHVVVHNVSLTVKPLENRPRPEGAAKQIDSIVVSTPSAEIYPEAVDLSALRIQLPEPINVAGSDQPNKSLLKVTSNVPLTTTVAQKTVNNVAYNSVSYQSPTTMEFTYLREEQAKGEEEKTPTLEPVYDTLTFSTAQGSGFTSDIAADKSGLGEMKLTYKDITLTPKSAPEGALKIAEITSSWSNSLNEKKLNVVHGALKMGPVTSAAKDAPYLPLALDVDATYEGAMPKTPEAIASIQSQDSSMVLKSFSLTSKDASLKATANFTANAADVLPVGTANVTLTNAPFVLGELRKYGVLNAQSEPMVDSVVLLITGQPVAQLKDLVVPVERARGGSFKIGNTTFEELFAVFLKQAMQTRSGQPPIAPAPGQPPLPASGIGAPMVPPAGAPVVGQPPVRAPGVITAPPPGAQPPHVPTLPPADKPKAAPIPVPDHGVRG